MQWKYPLFTSYKKAKVVSFAGKMMAQVFWDAKGIAFIDYVQKGHTIASPEYFANILKQLRKASKTKGSFPPDNDPARIYWFQWLLCVTAALNWSIPLLILCIWSNLLSVPQHEKHIWQGN